LFDYSFLRINIPQSGLGSDYNEQERILSDNTPSRTVPHVAFEVDDLEAALEGKEILIPPNCPSEGVRVAMIVDNGALVELLEFDVLNF
jgi:hypothetical protein